MNNATNTTAHSKPKRFDYNIIVIGGGSAGLVAAYIAAAVKAKVALIEKNKMGGDCLNSGCVPSKALIRTARFIADLNRANVLGIARAEAQFNFAEVMERVQRVIEQVAPHDSVARYTQLGVECISGVASVISPWEVAVNGRRLTTRSIIIATGARPLVPPIAGLEQGSYLTSDNVWQLRQKPKRLLVLGGGPIGCELAQSFQRLGTEVTLVQGTEQILPREDKEVAAEVANRFLHEGIALRTEHRAIRFERHGEERLVVCEHRGKEVALPYDEVLIALGRRPNVSGFGLQELGVEIAPHGSVKSDPFLRTNFPNIFVCGDVAGPYQFTHTASHQAWYASVNALLAPLWKFRVDYSVIPWATYTDPEVARVGLNELEAGEQNIPYEVTTYHIDELDRAITDGEAHGFVKVLTVPGRDKILGATIVGNQAGELITEFVTAMKFGLGLNKILSTIHIYPTLSEANKYVAGQWKQRHKPEWLLPWVERFHRWRRG